jgi:large subunit ribosomal protein L15
MKAPVRAKPLRQTTPLKVNTDQRKLDEVYVRFLGRGGDTLLSEETKWLAVTSKSFDHGRRGFNDRLAFFGESPPKMHFSGKKGIFPGCGLVAYRWKTGKRILELQCSLGLLSVSSASSFLKGRDKDPHGREPFRHPAIESAECLLGGAHEWYTHHKQLSNLATQYGLPEVVRWYPKDVSLRQTTLRGSRKSWPTYSL